MFQIKANWGKLCIEHQLFSFCCFVQTSSPGGETGASPQPITSKCSSHLLLRKEVSYRLLRCWPTMESIVECFDQDTTDWCRMRGMLPAAMPLHSTMWKDRALRLWLLHGSHYYNKPSCIIRVLVLWGLLPTMPSYWAFCIFLYLPVLPVSWTIMQNHRWAWTT